MSALANFVSLGEVATSIMGQAPSGASCNKNKQGTIFVKAGEFSDVFPIVREWTTEPIKLAKKGDVLVCVVGATAGKVNLAFDCAIGRSVAALRPDIRRVDPIYLYNFMKTKVEFLRNKSQGLAQGVLTRDMLEALVLPLPSLDAQRRIALILDKASALRRKRERMQQLLGLLTQATFFEMFGDPRIESARWNMLNFSQACTDVTSNSKKMQQTKYLECGKYPVVDQGQMLIAGWGNDEEFATHISDPVIIFGDHTRNVKFIDFDFIVGADGAKVLKASVLYEPRFFCELLRLMPIPNLGYSRHMRVVKELSFPCPPLCLQQKFVKRCNMTEYVAQRNSKISKKNDALFASLQHRAFTGQL